MIDQQLMKILVVALLLVIGTYCDICTQNTQKTFYMSFQTLSKRDTLQNIFQEMSKNMTVMQTNYTDSKLQANFHLTNIHPHMFYNDHEQKDLFVDKYTCNVSMGVIAVASFFNYTINYASTTKKGTFRVRGFLDPSYITKKLLLTDGYIEWKPEHVPAFTFSQDFFWEVATPNVTDDEKNTILSMINNRAGTRRIKDQMIIQINTKFGPMLTNMLNHQDLINSKNITYTYSNIELHFENLAKNFGLSNDTTKGLEAEIIFGLEDSTQNCTKLPVDFDEKQYGGLQELYTMGSVRSIVKSAIKRGLFDKVVDSKWDVSGFQFYMGDLGNIVPYANNHPANDSFKVKCTYNTSRESQLKISRYDQHQIYLGVPQTCIINYKDKDIIQLDMDLTIIVRLFGESSSVRVVVESAGVFKLSWQSSDPNYQITSQYLASYAVSEVINGLVDKPTFGTDFPIVKRKYPVIRILDDYLIIFDPSEY